MRLIDADALMDDIKRDSKKAIDEGDKVGSFWLGHAAGLVIKLPTIQPEKAQLSKEGTISDLISRQAAIDAAKDWYECLICGSVNGLIKRLNALPTIQPEPQWIPFTTRPMTEEEKEEHPEWDSILVCELPDDGQRILISVSVRGHESVQYDEFYTDDGSYLDSGYEIGTEAVAWMPLPEAYKPNK